MAREVFFSSHDGGRSAGKSSGCCKLLALAEFSGELDHDNHGEMTAAEICDVLDQLADEFVEDVTQEALGTHILTSLTPGQQVIKSVNDKLTELLGARPVHCANAA